MPTQNKLQIDIDMILMFVFEAEVLEVELMIFTRFLQLKLFHLLNKFYEMIKYLNNLGRTNRKI